MAAVKENYMRLWKLAPVIRLLGSRRVGGRQLPTKSKLWAAAPQPSPARSCQIWDVDLGLVRRGKFSARRRAGGRGRPSKFAVRPEAD